MIRLEWSFEGNVFFEEYSEAGNAFIRCEELLMDGVEAVSVFFVDSAEE